MPAPASAQAMRIVGTFAAKKKINTPAIAIRIESTSSLASDTRRNNTGVIARDARKKIQKKMFAVVAVNALEKWGRARLDAHPDTEFSIPQNRNIETAISGTTNQRLPFERLEAAFVESAFFSGIDEIDDASSPIAINMLSNVKKRSRP